MGSANVQWNLDYLNPFGHRKILRCSDSQNRSDNENQNGVHDRKSTGERDRHLIALSSTHTHF